MATTNTSTRVYRSSTMLGTAYNLTALENNKKNNLSPMYDETEVTSRAAILSRLSIGMAFNFNRGVQAG